jgi:hypothetical protein
MTLTSIGTALGACLVLTACGGSTSVTRSAPTASPSPAESTQPAVQETESPPTLRGNAATNPACALLSSAQVSALSRLKVVAILGLPADTTDPAKHSESCTWLLDPKDVQSSLVVQYTLYARPPADVRGYYPQVIAQGFGKAVPHLGDISKIQGHVLDTVYRRAEIHVSLLTHAEATRADQAASVAVMRLVMAGLHQ